MNMLRRVNALTFALLLPFITFGCAGSESTAKDGNSVAGTDASAPGGVLIPASLDGPAPSQRIIDSTGWQVVWTRGGKREEALLAVVPTALPYADGVVLVDEGTLQIHAFDRLTGDTRWSVGRKGGGPGEFQQINDITMDSAGNVLALDIQLGRISTIAPNGSLLAYRTPGPQQHAASICALRDGSLIGVTQQPDAWLTRSDSSTQLARYAFPVELPASAPTMVTGAAFARGEASDACTVFTMFGYGIGSVTTDARSITLRPYAEALEQPTFTSKSGRVDGAPVVRTEMASGTSAATRGSTWNDTVLVTFRGMPGPDKPVLDLFDRSGRYRGSWPSPHSDLEYAVYANGTLYTMRNSMVAPQLVAWRRISASERVSR